MENVIPVLWVGLDYKVATHIAPDQLHESLFQEWLKIPAENKHGVSLMVTDSNDYTDLSSGTKLAEQRFQFLENVDHASWAAFAASDDSFFACFPLHRFSDGNRDELVSYVRKYMLKPIYKTAEAVGS